MFKHSNIKRNQIHKLMNKGLQQKKYTIRKMREESYQNLIDDLSKRKSFDKSLVNQQLSPTYKTHSHSFQKQKLNEEKDSFWTELDSIIEELESD